MCRTDLRVVEHQLEQHMGMPLYVVSVPCKHLLVCRLVRL